MAASVNAASGTIGSWDWTAKWEDISPSVSPLSISGWFETSSCCYVADVTAVDAVRIVSGIIQVDCVLIASQVVTGTAQTAQADSHSLPGSSNLPQFMEISHPNFRWGTVDGITFINLIDKAYDEVIHWRRNSSSENWRPWNNKTHQYCL